MYIHIHVHIKTVNKNEATNLKDSEEDKWEGRSKVRKVGNDVIILKS